MVQKMREMTVQEKFGSLQKLTPDVQEYVQQTLNRARPGVPLTGAEIAEKLRSPYSVIKTIVYAAIVQFVLIQLATKNARETIYLTEWLKKAFAKNRPLRGSGGYAAYDRRHYHPRIARIMDAESKDAFAEAAETIDSAVVQANLVQLVNDFYNTVIDEPPGYVCVIVGNPPSAEQIFTSAHNIVQAQGLANALQHATPKQMERVTDKKKRLTKKEIKAMSEEIGRQGKMDEAATKAIEDVLGKMANKGAAHVIEMDNIFAVMPRRNQMRVEDAAKLGLTAPSAEHTKRPSETKRQSNEAGKLVHLPPSQKPLTLAEAPDSGVSHEHTLRPSEVKALQKQLKKANGNPAVFKPKTQDQLGRQLESAFSVGLKAQAHRDSRPGSTPKPKPGPGKRIDPTPTR